MFIFFFPESIVTDMRCSGQRQGACGGQGLPSTDVMYSIRFQSPLIYINRDKIVYFFDPGNINSILTRVPHKNVDTFSKSTSAVGTSWHLAWGNVRYPCGPNNR